ncbi:MAG: DegV family protein [Acidimicrobiia bacterium]
MHTAVVTDSSGIMQPAPGVRVVPITVLLPDTEAPDHRVPPQRVVAALRRHEPVKTRAPSVVDYVEVLEHGDAPAAVVITPAAELTAMWRNATNAVYLTDVPAAVVDSRTAAAGQALVVSAACRCAEEGGTLDDVVAAAEDASRRVRLVATVGSPGPIGESGILPPSTVEALGTAATRLPLFRLSGGLVEVAHLAPAGADPAVELAALWRAEGGPQGERAVVFTAHDHGAGARLARMVGAGPVEHPSAAMAVHTGPGVIGVAWLCDGPAASA